MRLGVDGERPLPASRVEQIRGGEVLGEFRTEPSDVPQCPGAYGVVGADAHRGEAVAVAQLHRAVPDGLAVHSATGRPGVRAIGVAHAGRGDIADGGVAEGADHFGEIGRGGHVVAVELRDHVVALIAPIVVEVGEVAFLAAGAARPVGPVVGGHAAAAGHPHPVPSAPRGDLLGRVLVAQPYVVGVRKILGQHRLERPPGGGPRLRGGAGDGEGDRYRGDRQVRVDPANPERGDEEVAGQAGEVEQQDAVDDQSRPADAVLGAQPPGPEVEEAQRPAHGDRREEGPVAAGERGHEGRRPDGAHRERQSEDGAHAALIRTTLPSDIRASSRSSSAWSAVIGSLCVMVRRS